MKGGDKMRNFHKKKVNVFGKKVSVLLITAIAVLGLAAAALVPYLTGLVVGEVTVESPINLYGAQIEDVSVPELELETDSLLSGETLNGGGSDGFWIKVENLADHVVQGNLVFEISNDEGLTEAEIKEIISGIEIYDWAHSASAPTDKQRLGPYTVQDLETAGKLVLVDMGDGETYRVSYPDLWLWTNSVTDDTELIYVKVSMNFPVNAIGKYTIKATVFEDGQDVATVVFPTSP